MKYLVRVVKYYIYLVVVLAIFIAVLMLLNMVGTSVEEIFKNGARSLWQIAGIVAVFAVIYPLMGFTRRSAMIPGEYADLRQGIVDLMHDRGYVLESENTAEPGHEVITFRKRSPVLRLTRMFEDRITMEKDFGGFSLEGPSKDLVRVIGALEFKFRNPSD